MNSLKFYAIIFLAFSVYEIESQFYTTPKNYVYYINNSHSFYWYDAFLACNARGMALATFDTTRKYEDFLGFWQSQPLNPAPFPLRSLWVGSVGGASGYTWLSTGRPIIYSLWLLENNNNLADNSQGCVEVWRPSLKGLNNFPCNSLLGYVCESRGCCQENIPNVLLNITK